MKKTFLKGSAAGYLSAWMLLCLFLCAYGLQRIFGFTLLPDEFGYWLPAARALGWDWSGAASLGSYYSFGYSLILTPLLAFFPDPLTAYRAAVAVNMLLMCAGLYLMYRLMLRLFEREGKERAALVSGIAVLSPVWIYYVQMTMTEALLLFLYVLICFLLVRFLEKPGVAAAVLLAAALIYIYFVHMRSLGILAAGGATLLAGACLMRKERAGRTALISLLFLAVFFAAGIGIRNGLMAETYGAAPSELLSVNDYTGQWGKVRSLFSPSGLRDFGLSLSGKLLYMGLSTYGLAWRGLIYALQRAAEYGKASAKRDGQGQACQTALFWVFLSLATVFQLGIVSLYTIGSVREGFGRLDLFVHGRYEEPVIPVLTAVGMYRLLQSRRRWGETGLVIGGAAILNLTAASVAGRVAYPDNQAFFMTGMSYLARFGTFEPVSYLWKAFGLGVLLTVLVTAAAAASVRVRRERILSLTVAMQVFLGIWTCEGFLYTSNSYGEMDAVLAEHLETVLEECASQEKETRTIYLYGGDQPYIDRIQFRLQEKKIEVWRDGTEGLTEQDIVIADTNGEWVRSLYEQYGHYWHGGHLDLFYND